MESHTLVYITDRRTFISECHGSGRSVDVRALHEFSIGHSGMPREKNALSGFARSLGESVQEKFPDGLEARLIIPSSWCFAQSVELPSEKFSDQAACFEFERFLPVELESLTCGVWKTGATTALVGGVSTAAMATLFDDLEHYGLFIQSCFVDAFLLAIRIHSESVPQAMNLLDDQRVAIATQGMSTGTAVRTVRLPELGSPNREAVLNRALAGVRDTDSQILTYDLNAQSDRQTENRMEEASGRLPNTEAMQTHCGSQAVSELFRLAVESTPVIDFRTGELAFAGRFHSIRAPLLHAAVALALLLVVTAATLSWQAAGYTDQIATLTATRGEIYQRVYESSSVPPGAALQLRSERIKLEGMTTTDGVDDTLHDRRGLAVIESLAHVIAALPDDVKISVDELVIDASAVELAGRTTAHSHAGRLVQGLNRLSRIAATPPRTKLRTDETVDFRIRAEFVEQ